MNHFIEFLASPSFIPEFFHAGPPSCEARSSQTWKPRKDDGSGGTAVFISVYSHIYICVCNIYIYIFVLYIYVIYIYIYTV